MLRNDSVAKESVGSANMVAMLTQFSTIASTALFALLLEYLRMQNPRNGHKCGWLPSAQNSVV